MQQVKAVVARAKGAPVELVTINVPDPGPGEAVVKVQACGVCHTDLHYREGGINDDFPFLLGHEAVRRRRGGRPRRHRRRAGRLRGPQLARGVRRLPGLQARRAAVLLRHPQRDAEDDAAEDRAPSCRRRSASARSPRRPWSPPASAPRSTRRRAPAAVGLLGCGVMAGIGAAINTGARHPRQVRRGHRLRRRRRGRDRGRGAGRRHPDHRGRHRRQEARGGEADGRHPHRRLVVDRPGRGDQADLRDRRGADGADVVIEAVGRPETWKQAFYARDLAGTVVLVGVPTPGHEGARPPADRRLRPRRRR